MKIRTRARTDVPVSVNIDVKGLPVGWSAWRSPHGYIFYYNGSTGLFTWEKPHTKPKPKY